MTAQGRAPSAQGHATDKSRTAGPRPGRWALCCAVAILVGRAVPGFAQSEYARAIAQVKPSIVAVGTFERLRNPEFRFLGTGFAVGNGSIVATNSHVVPEALDSARYEVMAIALRAPDHSMQIRVARKVASDPSADLALLSIDGPPLPALRIGQLGTRARGRHLAVHRIPDRPGPGAVSGDQSRDDLLDHADRHPRGPCRTSSMRARSADWRQARFLSSSSMAPPIPATAEARCTSRGTGEVVGIVNMVFVKGTKEAALTNPSGISYAIPADKLSDLLAGTR